MRCRCRRGRTAPIRATTDSRDSRPFAQRSVQRAVTSAQDNDLPVPFFANLIWQESRLRDDAVSRKGALGIAQFMPETAAETGLDNPFDPLQSHPGFGALPARASPAIRQSRLCRRRLQCRRPPRHRMARASRQPAARDARLCRAGDRALRRRLAQHGGRMTMR